MVGLIAEMAANADYPSRGGFKFRSIKEAQAARQLQGK